MERRYETKEERIEWLEAEVQRLKDQGKTACDLFDELKKSQAEVQQLNLQNDELRGQLVGEANKSEVYEKRGRRLEKELEESNRLNGEYRMALEKILHLKEATPSVALEAVWIAKDALLGTNHMEKRVEPSRYFCNKCGFSGTASDLVEGEPHEARHRRSGADGLCGYSAVELQS